MRLYQITQARIDGSRTSSLRVMKKYARTRSVGLVFRDPTSYRMAPTYFLYGDKSEFLKTKKVI